MSTTKHDFAVVGWRFDYEDFKKLANDSGDEFKFDEEFIEPYEADYHHPEKNNDRQLYCFFDGRDGRFVIYGVILGAQKDEGEIIEVGNQDLKRMEDLAIVQRNIIPESLRPEDWEEPKLIVFSIFR